jgi:hypothetical protein
MMQDHTAIGGANEWSIDVHFDADGTGTTRANAVADVPFTYPEDTWFDVHAIVDLNNDLAELYIDGVLVREWPWSADVLDGTATPNPVQLGVADFWPADQDNPMYFLDNVYLIEAAPITTSVQELTSMNSFSLYPNPNNGSFTIESGELSGSFVIDMIDITGRVVYSKQFEMSSNENKAINSTDLNPSVYILRMVDKTTNKVYTTRVTVQ